MAGTWTKDMAKEFAEFTDGAKLVTEQGAEVLDLAKFDEVISHTPAGLLEKGLYDKLATPLHAGQGCSPFALARDGSRASRRQTGRVTSPS